MTKHLPYDRAERVGTEIYHILCEVVLVELQDPRLAGVRITRIGMTKDLRTARVNFHMAHATGERRLAALKGLKSAGGFFKRRIGDAIKLKFMPELEFFYDEAVDVDQRIENLLEGIKRD